MIKLEFSNQTEFSVNQQLFEPYLKRSAETVDALGNQSGYVELTLLGEAEMRKINREQRGKDYATDVISLGYLDSVDELKGEIFICMAVAEKQAVERGHSVEKELGTLFVHGLLHVAGYDHETDEEEAEMEKMAAIIIQ